MTEPSLFKLLKGLQVYKLAYKLNVRQQELFACFPQAVCGHRAVIGSSSSGITNIY